MLFAATVVYSSIALLGAAWLAAVMLLLRGGRTAPQSTQPPPPPGPRPLPVIGNLHLLGAHDSPFEAFTALAKRYGDVYSLVLGSTPCVVVNSFQLIKEVLINRGADFGGRPDFIRFHMLFGGDRNNSLALCDWSSLQKTRRSIARAYCSPRSTSAQYELVDEVGHAETRRLLGVLRTAAGAADDIKPLVLAACANMFTQYMCSTRFDYDDAQFKGMVRNFDQIFWEINQGYALDFLPWLRPLYGRHLARLAGWAADIRQFIMAHIVQARRGADSRAGATEPRDFTDALLLSHDADPLLTWQHILFELEDFIGGHSAIGNLVMLALGECARRPEVASRVRAEADAVDPDMRAGIAPRHRPLMPYTEAVLWETLRTCSSPIVPHVASVDTQVGGHTVRRGTVVFINNYELNLSEQYWRAASRFMPERFVDTTGDTARLAKPPHFIPFSTGRRTCIGQRLVQGFAFVLLASIVQRYELTLAPRADRLRRSACMAVPPDGYCIQLQDRHNT